jgi:hypothetical protein
MEEEPIAVTDPKQKKTVKFLFKSKNDGSSENIKSGRKNNKLKYGKFLKIKF